MKIFLALILMLAPVLPYAQTSLKNTPRGTFPVSEIVKQQEEEERRRQQQQQQTPQPRRASTISSAPVYTPVERPSVQPRTQPPAPQPQQQPQRTVIITYVGQPYMRGNKKPAGMRGWPRKALNIDAAKLTGAGVKIALFDSGASPNKELNGKVILYDITGKGNPSDESGHGTSIAGVLAGGSGSKFKSVAPDARIHSYKVTYQERAHDGQELTKTNNIYIREAVEEVLEYNRQRPDTRVDIINLSYGLDTPDKTLEDALRRAYDEGITIVAAAGNESRGAVLYPSAYDFVIGAGAINSDKQFTDFSNYGAGLDFVAPGQDIFSLDNKGGYDWWGGTSYSAAYITGVSALIIQAWQDKHGKKPTPRQVYETLVKISEPLPSVPGDKQGRGLPDASKIMGAV